MEFSRIKFSPSLKRPLEPKESFSQEEWTLLMAIFRARILEEINGRKVEDSMEEFACRLTPGRKDFDRDPHIWIKCVRAARRYDEVIGYSRKS